MDKPKYPQLQDEEANKLNEATGIVIAFYEDADGTPFLDVRKSDDSGVWYRTFAENWETISTEEERQS